MTGKPEAQGGTVLRCDTDGRIREVLRDELGLAGVFAVGHPFPVLVAEADLPKALNFVAAVRDEAAQFNWQVAARLRDRLAVLNLSGYMLDGELLVSATLADPGDATFDAIARLSNDQASQYRSLFSADERADGGSALNDMARLNNDFAELQRELARKNAELVRANERKTRLLGVAAHDLRSPLNIISGFAEFVALTAAERLTAAENNSLAMICQSIGHMVKVIDSVLELSVVESGRLKLDSATADLAALVAEVAELEAAVAARRDVTVQPPPPGPPLPLEFDAGKIRQVLHNLIGNAVKYSAGGTHVAVRIEPRAGDVRVLVADQGPGIAEGEVGRLFQPFARTSARSQDGSPSTGLGLSICRSIVEAHGGAIGVDSTPGAGSTFFFTLPRAAAG